MCWASLTQRRSTERGRQTTDFPTISACGASIAYSTLERNALLQVHICSPHFIDYPICCQPQWIGVDVDERVAHRAALPPDGNLIGLFGPELPIPP
jgi:hypothetical protein